MSSPEQLTLSKTPQLGSLGLGPLPSAPQPFLGGCSQILSCPSVAPIQAVSSGIHSQPFPSAKINEIRPSGWKSPAPLWGDNSSWTLGADDDAWRCLWLPRGAVGDALGRASGLAGGTLAVLTPHPTGVMPCLGEGEEPGRERLPLSAQPQPSRSVCENWAGGHARLDRGQLRPVGCGGSALMGKPVIQRALREGWGRQERETH